MSRSKSAVQSSTKSTSNTRTTRTGVLLVAKSDNLIARAEYPLKADKSAKAMIAELLKKHVEWGTYAKAPALQKEPYVIQIDDTTVVHIAVVITDKGQCSVCGSWDNDTKYCPACRGEWIDDSIDIDI
jgi:hypothetical protein